MYLKVVCEQYTSLVFLCPFSECNDLIRTFYFVGKDLNHLEEAIVSFFLC